MTPSRPHCGACRRYLAYLCSPRSRGDGLRQGAWSTEPASVFASLSSLLRLPTSSMPLTRHRRCD